MRVTDVRVSVIVCVRAELLALRGEETVGSRGRADEGLRVAGPAGLGLGRGGLGAAPAAEVEDCCGDEGEEGDAADGYACDAAGAEGFGARGCGVRWG